MFKVSVRPGEKLCEKQHWSRKLEDLSKKTGMAVREPLTPMLQMQREPDH